MRRVALGLLLLASMACHAVPKARASAATQEKRHGKGEYVARLHRDAAALRSLVTSPFAHRFLEATRALPEITTRKVGGVEIDEQRYFDGDISNPLHYARALDLVAARGADVRAGSKVLDFGYGTVGHLRLLATLGLDVTGIDVRPELAAIYSEPGDTGTITGIDDRPGNLRLLTGHFPSPDDAALAHSVGGGYDIVLSKNTLKKGYIHPDRPAPEKWLIRLGVDDATFLKAFHDLLAPRGRMLLYNVYVPIPLDQPFKPMSDGRSPFSKEQWEAEGFVVEAFDHDDTEMVRKVFAATREEETEAVDFRALYTLVRRRDD